MGQRIDSMKNDLSEGALCVLAALAVVAALSLLMSGIAALARVLLFLKNGLWLRSLCDGIAL
ncbi:hypothetical protein NXC12_CH03041 [Rhizobium etli]|uniref:Uncharacterized protein n=1 Tax=Rhizobium etli TaxID=29449 RepID=A0AAN1BGZ4_RHIET|nr:hypothetical protein [Rhizobium etli]ARQ11034.1 hypothetical protein NXC12_CH03041 [Rhizobium etli]